VRISVIHLIHAGVRAQSHIQPPKADDENAQTIARVARLHVSRLAGEEARGKIGVVSDGMAVELAQLRDRAGEADGLPLRILAMHVAGKLGEGVVQPTGRRVHLGFARFEPGNIILGDLKAQAEMLLFFFAIGKAC
jgi:hypothetical protein